MWLKFDKEKFEKQRLDFYLTWSTYLVASEFEKKICKKLLNRYIKYKKTFLQVKKEKQKNVQHLAPQKTEMEIIQLNWLQKD